MKCIKGLKQIIAFSISIISLLIVNGCATVPQIKYQKRISFDFEGNTPAKQTNQGITIELKPINDDLKESRKEEYKTNIRVKYIPFLATQPVIKDVEYQIGLYLRMLPFEATIFNNTDHILRMKDSRVVYISPGSDEPLIALNRDDILNNIESLPVYNYLAHDISNRYSLTEVSAVLPIALSKVVKRVKFINNFEREIMPGMKYTGIIVFPIDPVKASEGTISFIDMVSETDMAGIPTKKVRFDYKIKPMYKYYRCNESTDKEWVEIPESEYGLGKEPTSVPATNQQEEGHSLEQQVKEEKKVQEVSSQKTKAIEPSNETKHPKLSLKVIKSGNVRSTPSTSSKIIAKVKKGEMLQGQGKSGDWYIITLPSGESGWVFKGLVRMAE